MKKILVLAVFLCASLVQAQITKNLGDFEAVKVFDKLTVKLVPSKERKVVITGARASEVEVINSNGILKLRMPFPKLLSGNDIKIDLHFIKLESIDASEGSYISSDFPFEQTTISLNTKEGAQIKAELNVDKAVLRAVSGGILDVTGKAKSQSIIIASGGILEGQDLESEQTDINVSAGGRAEIYATTLVDAKVKAGGTIYIYGKPKQINQETILGGTIIQK